MLTETGAVKINGNYDGMKRTRRKLKMFYRELAEGKRTVADIMEYMQSQCSYCKNCDDHGRIFRLRRLNHAMMARYMRSRAA